MMQWFDAYNEGDLLWLGNWSPTWLVVLAILGLTVILVSAYDLRTLSPFRRWMLVALRTAVYGLAVLLLLEPAVYLKHVETIKNDVAVLVDTSRTMSLKTDGETNRYDRVGSALDDLEDTFQRRSDEHEFEVHRFDKSMTSASREGLIDHTPEGTESNLSGALHQLQDQYADSDLGGIVLLTDGIDTGAIGERTPRGAKLDTETRQLLEEFDAPINTVSAARASELKDAAVAEVQHDDFAFVHNKVSIDVVVQATGLGRTEFPVTLRRKGELIQTQQLSVKPDQMRYELTFEFVPQQIGKELYSVSVPEFSGEALLQNNVAHFLQPVIRDKIRVLQVVGQPSWDERFTRRLLKKNPNIDLISFFILRTNSNVRLVPQNEMSLIPFPTRELFEEELGSFDLVIFQNFNFGPYRMRQYLDSIADYVRDGGGFAMIGGNLSFASGGYAGTPIEDILPVKLPNSTNPDVVLDTTPFRPKLTGAGTRHPITQMAFDPASNREIWQNLPKLRGTNVVREAKPEATVLAEHPTRENDGRPMPVLTVSEKGDGRTMALTSDSTWRWNFEHVGQGGTPREYQVFWNSAIRWLIKDPELKLIQVDIPEEVYPPGDDLEANISISKPDYTPAKNLDGTVDLMHRSFETIREQGASSSPDVIASKDFKTNAQGQYQAEFPVDDPGVYTVAAQSDTSAGTLEDREIVLSIPDVEEFRNIVPRNEMMSQFASATGGHAATLPDFNPGDLEFDESSRVEINRRKVVHLWNSVVVFILILALLTAEWTLRRRWGRL